MAFADIPVSGHLEEKIVCLECISDKTINCDGYRCKPQCISPAICLTLESYKCTWHRTSHIDPESAKNCQILAWETCNVYINCDINSNHDCTTLTISTEIDKMVSVIFNMHFNENFKKMWLNMIKENSKDFDNYHVSSTMKWKGLLMLILTFTLTQHKAYSLRVLTQRFT